jgi:Xaa-Pro aminopeptidase
MMETMQPTLKNGRNVWDPINLPVVEFEERIGKLQARMKEKNIDVLLAYGYAYDHYGNATYLSNFIPDLTRGTLVVVTRDGGVTLFFEGSPRGLPSAKTTTWVEDVRACPNISREAARYLEEKGLLSSTIGFAGIYQWMPQDQLGFLLDFLEEASLVDVDHVIRDMRRIKSSREQDQIRRSSRIVRKVCDFLASGTFSNWNEKSIEASIFRVARLEGAEDVRVLFGKSQDEAWALRPSEHGSLEVGKSIMLHVAVEFERYWSEASRTFVIGDETLAVPELKSIDALYERMQGQLSAGKEADQVCKDITGEIARSQKEYIPDYGLGYGIGLAPQEAPWITEDNRDRVEKGMSLALRLAVKDENLGAIMMGDTFAVTDRGLECLTG